MHDIFQEVINLILFVLLTLRVNKLENKLKMYRG